MLHYCQIALIIQVQNLGKKHALNNQYAPNSELRLLTHVYGISSREEATHNMTTPPWTLELYEVLFARLQFIDC